MAIILNDKLGFDGKQIVVDQRERPKNKLKITKSFRRTKDQMILKVQMKYPQRDNKNHGWKGNWLDDS